MEEIRLNKYLGERGICSRREADRLIEAGKVLVDGVPASMGMKVHPDQVILCAGKPVGAAAAQKPVLLMVNKPRGIVCTTSEKDRAVNIVDFLNYPTRIYPMGRLDKDSEGLLLMTNQGDLVNRMMRAGNAHEKEYVVTVDKPLTAAFLKAMEEGIPILETVTRPCVITATGKQEFRIVLTQGMNRQIRRMCEYLGYRVRTLKRERIMNLCLGSLKTGDYREVTLEEYQDLLKHLGDSKNISSETDGFDRSGVILHEESQHGNR
ncbi:MAG: pseudouridine synthase [Hungatella sp.]